MRIGSRGAGRFIFLVAEDLAQIARYALELRRRIAIESTGERSPSRVAGKRGLFLLARLAFIPLKALQDPESCDIVAGFLGKAALADQVRLRYPEVAGRFRLGLDIQE